MLLRNHLDTNSLDKFDNHAVNMTRMQLELYRLMGAKDKSVVATSVYSLHEHKTLAIALHKAMSWKSDAIALGSASDQLQPGFHRSVSSFLDGDLLLEQFEQAADTITQGWIGAHEKTTPNLCKSLSRWCPPQLLRISID